jgi:hypothetical protein
MSRDRTTVRVPLSVGGLRLRLSYCAVRDRIARGELVGGRDEFGRWYVELPPEDREQRATQPEPA